jgi:hypothetical protein
MFRFGLVVESNFRDLALVVLVPVALKETVLLDLPVTAVALVAVEVTSKIWCCPTMFFLALGVSFVAFRLPVLLRTKTESTAVTRFSLATVKQLKSLVAVEDWLA